MATTIRYREDGERRRFARVPFAGTFRYYVGPERHGTGLCADVGRGGVAASLGRYVRPGRLAMLRFEGVGAESLEFKAQVAWCAPTVDPAVFRVGFRLLHDELSVTDGASQLIFAALTPAPERERVAAMNNFAFSSLLTA